MIINFTQGIIAYPTSGNLQGFLARAGQFVSIVADNGHTDVAVVHGLSNYLISESVSIANAWGPLTSGVEYWLYWDINTTTAVLTRGFTPLAPIYGGARPTEAANGQHWFDSTNRKMYVLQNARWREVIRVFAARVIDSSFTPLGSGFSSKPFAGTQVGLIAENALIGRIIVDNAGLPIRRNDGRFFTTEDDFFVNGSPVNSVRLESGIITATAQSNLAKYQVVKFSDFNSITPADYGDVEETAIAIVMEDAVFGSTATVCIQGHITNPEWNWTTVGAPLWVTTGGQLTQVDPHEQNPIANQIGKAPVGRVLTQSSIIFDQGLGGKGDRGEPGSASSGLASNVVVGNVRLTVPAASANDPVVVGDNDPRNTNARTPTAHTHPSTAITTAAQGSLTGATLNLQLGELDSGKLSKSGGTMTGALTLNADPVNALHSATKGYVDSAIGAIVIPTPTPAALSALTDVTVTAPTASQILSYNGTRWVNTAAPTQGAGALSALTDVALTSPAASQFLSFNGTKWVNVPAPGGGGDVDLNLIMDEEIVHWSKEITEPNLDSMWSRVDQLWRFDKTNRVYVENDEKRYDIITAITGQTFQTPTVPSWFSYWIGWTGDQHMYGEGALTTTSIEPVDRVTVSMPASSTAENSWTLEFGLFLPSFDYSTFGDNPISVKFGPAGEYTYDVKLDGSTTYGVTVYTVTFVPSWNDPELGTPSIQTFTNVTAGWASIAFQWGRDYDDALVAMVVPYVNGNSNNNVVLPYAFGTAVTIQPIFTGNGDPNNANGGRVVRYCIDELRMTRGTRYSYNPDVPAGNYYRQTERWPANGNVETKTMDLGSTAREEGVYLTANDQILLTENTKLVQLADVYDSGSIEDKATLQYDAIEKMWTPQAPSMSNGSRIDLFSQQNINFSSGNDTANGWSRAIIQDIPDVYGSTGTMGYQIGKGTFALTLHVVVSPANGIWPRFLTLYGTQLQESAWPPATVVGDNHSMHTRYLPDVVGSEDIDLLAAAAAAPGLSAIAHTASWTDTYIIQTPAGYTSSSFRAVLILSNSMAELLASANITATLTRLTGTPQSNV